MRESMGISAETTTRAFREDYVEAFVQRPRPELRPNRRIYVAVDPSGGGASAYAIASLVKDDEGRVIVSLACPPHTERARANATHRLQI